MRNVLADLALESEAATMLAIRLARAFDRSGDAHEAVMARLLTPIAKFWICKRGSHFAQEAMECLGGNGYVEEGGEGIMARIYREMPLNSIWEGAGNIMALDLLRALRKGDVVAALAHELAPSKGAHPALDRLVAALPARVEEMASELEARRLAQDVALAVQGALLYQAAARCRVRRILRFPAGGLTGPGVRHASRCNRFRHHHCASHAALNDQGNNARPDPAPLPQLAVFREDPHGPGLQEAGLEVGNAFRPFMPKPDVLALTGGYRKTPVLQVGADIYCDSALICDVLEHVQPDPPPLPPHLKGVARVFAQWADTTLFWAAMAYNLQPKGAAHVFAKAPPEAAKAFAEDRKAMSSNMVRLRPGRRDIGSSLLPAAHRPYGGGA
jgi:hypothetical protein